MIRAVLLWLLLPFAVHAGEVRLAVASNMYPAARVLAETFETATGHRVTIAHGATGRLYTQITRGAPFDIFLSADAARPERLAAEGTARDRRTYALGRLVRIGAAELGTARRIAIADPSLAPYGVAAIEYLAHEGLDVATLPLALAENISQVAVWVETGNADAGLLAASLVSGLDDDIPVTEIPANAHAPIRQDGVLLNETDAARAFWDWLATEDAARILTDHGYDLP